jgi:hypothetical protein
VTTVGDAVRDLNAGDDDGTVVTALTVWNDLVESRPVVGDLLDHVDNHLDELRTAQEVAAGSPASLADDLAAQHAELKDLLAAGDLAGKLGRISAIASAITEQRASQLAELRAELIRRMDEERAALQARYPAVDPDTLAETLGQLEQLVPDEDAEVSPEVLEARLTAIHTTAAQVAHALDTVVAQDRLATVPISEIAPDLIRTPDDLNLVVERLQKRVAELLGDEKEVRQT